MAEGKLTVFTTRAQYPKGYGTLTVALSALSFYNTVQRPLLYPGANLQYQFCSACIEGTVPADSLLSQAFVPRVHLSD